MKKGKLINSEISYTISQLGHGDTLTIGDCGLPIPKHVPRIDLALTLGTPSFLETLEVVLEEQFIEGIIIAKELKTNNQDVHKALMEMIELCEEEQENTIAIHEVSHEQFKEKTKQCHAIIRTGEMTPYSNIILISGVVF